MSVKRTGTRFRSRPSNQRSALGRAVWSGDQSPEAFGPEVVDIHVGKVADSRSDEIRQGDGDRIPNLCLHGHEWVVYSTALQERWLMLQCAECGAMGTIDAPTTEEWSAAFHAPSRPYRWHDGTKVTVRGHAAPRVIRAIDGPRCDCPSRLSLPPGMGYERVPGGIWEHPGGLSDTEKAELIELAEFAGRSDLCSRSLPLFIQSFESHSGKRHSKATHMILDRFERWDSKGLHCSPQIVARIIREFAAWEPG